MDNHRGSNLKGLIRNLDRFKHLDGGLESTCYGLKVKYDDGFRENSGILQIHMYVGASQTRHLCILLPCL